MGGYGWWTYLQAPVISDATLEQFWERTKNDRLSPPDADDIRSRFREMGVDVSLPQQLSYNYLKLYGLGEFQRRQVRRLGVPARHGYAHVLILSPREFDLDRLGDNWQSEQGYDCRVEAVRFPGSSHVRHASPHRRRFQLASAANRTTWVDTDCFATNATRARRGGRPPGLPVHTPADLEVCRHSRQTRPARNRLF